VYLLPITNGAGCFFLTTKLVRTKIHLRSYSRYFKSKKINFDQILQKLQERETKNNIVSKRKLLKEKVTIYVLLYFH
jgi:hypothetical protein